MAIDSPFHRGVDETGNQIAVLGRLGSRPLSLNELRRLYLDDNGDPWFVSSGKDQADGDDITDDRKRIHAIPE